MRQTPRQLQSSLRETSQAAAWLTGVGDEWAAPPAGGGVHANDAACPSEVHLLPPIPAVSLWAERESLPECWAKQI